PRSQHGVDLRPAQTPRRRARLPDGLEARHETQRRAPGHARRCGNLRRHRGRRRVARETGGGAAARTAVFLILMNDWLTWQIVDSAFPTGTFSHSWGLEA